MGSALEQLPQVLDEQRGPAGAAVHRAPDSLWGGGGGSHVPAEGKEVTRGQQAGREQVSLAGAEGEVAGGCPARGGGGRGAGIDSTLGLREVSSLAPTVQRKPRQTHGPVSPDTPCSVLRPNLRPTSGLACRGSQHHAGRESNVNRGPLEAPPFPRFSLVLIPCRLRATRGTTHNSKRQHLFVSTARSQSLNRVSS